MFVCIWLSKCVREHFSHAGRCGGAEIYIWVCLSTLSSHYFWDRVLLLNLEFAELAGQESFQDPPLFPIVQVTGTHCHTWILNYYWWSKFRTSHLVIKCFIPCSISTAHTTSFCLMHSYTISSFITYQGTDIGLHSRFNLIHSWFVTAYDALLALGT